MANERVSTANTTKRTVPAFLTDSRQPAYHSCQRCDDRWSSALLRQCAVLSQNHTGTCFSLVLVLVYYEGILKTCANFVNGHSYLYFCRGSERHVFRGSTTFRTWAWPKSSKIPTLYEPSDKKKKGGSTYLRFAHASQQRAISHAAHRARRLHPLYDHAHIFASR